MTKDKLAILVIFALAATVGLLLGRNKGGTGGGEGANAPVAASQAAVRPGYAGQFRGISLQLQNGSPSHPFEQYIDEIADTGANAICLIVPAYQENASSTSIFIEARKAPSDERVAKLIDYAHKRGLRVLFMPIVLLENAKEDEWRGKIGAKDWTSTQTDDWWERYADLVLHYAQICQQTKAEVFMVGSELISLETSEDRWRDLIAQVRQAYKGMLSYSANWDHYKPVKFWDALDIIGMTTYYDLTGGKPVTLETLMDSWKPIKKEILDWQSKIGKPLIFTEVGWPNQVTCAQYPWDYYRSMDKPDTKAQALCYEAFFKTWIGEKAAGGFLVWEWRNYPQQKIGPEDTSYVPCGKPCLKVIEKYFAMSDPWQTASRPAAESRPGSGGPPLAATGDRLVPAENAGPAKPAPIHDPQPGAAETKGGSSASSGSNGGPEEPRPDMSGSDQE